MRKEKKLEVWQKVYLRDLLRYENDTGRVFRSAFGRDKSGLPAKPVVKSDTNGGRR
jgi:hypothetical protein